MSRTVRGLRLARLLPLALVSLLMAAVAVAGDWKGETTTVDGVPHVKNPASPMEEPMKVALQENWRLGGDSEDEDEFLRFIEAERIEAGLPAEEVSVTVPYTEEAAETIRELEEIADDSE